MFFIVLGTIISWVTWGMIVFNSNPEQAGFLVFSLFYLSLFLALSGLIFLVGYWFKKKFFKKQLPFYRVKSSVRHGVFFAILILSWAILKSHNLSRWWNLALLILILAILEFFFISTGKNNTYVDSDPTTQTTV